MVKCQECGEEVGDALICNVCGSESNNQLKI